MNVLSVYSIICTVITVFLAIFLARCGKGVEIQVIDGDSQSATKTDIGLLVYDAGSPNGGEGDSCICPEWNSVCILEICVMGTLPLLGVFGIYKLVKSMLVYLAKQRTKTW